MCIDKYLGDFFLPGPLNGLTRGFTTERATFNDLSATVSATLHGSRISTLVSLALAYTS